MRSDEHSNACDLVELPSRVGWALTVDRLERAIQAAGLRLFATIDHAAAAAAVGLKMPPRA